MNEEIKEKIKAYYVGDDIDKVLDYITNLQQLYENGLKVNQNSYKYITELEMNNAILKEENERLNQNNQSYQEEMARTWKIADDYKSRCEKAIEILKLCNSKCAKETINILQGSDEKRFENKQ